MAGPVTAPANAHNGFLKAGVGVVGCFWSCVGEEEWDCLGLFVKWKTEFWKMDWKVVFNLFRSVKNLNAVLIYAIVIVDLWSLFSNVLIPRQISTKKSGNMHINCYLL